MLTRPITRPLTQPLTRAISAAMQSTWNPRNLFAANDTGLFYDLNDLSTLFQDSDGTTPVTAAGQPVGLVLDKSKGGVPGPQLLSNGDFSAGSAGWTLDASWSIANGRAESAATGGNYLTCTAVTVKANTWYVIEYDFAITSGATQATIGGTLMTATSAGMSGRFKRYVLTTATTSFRIYANNAVAWFDNISVRELPGAHAFQATAASRPILRDAPRRIDYDAVDDVLNVTFPVALGSACTVARSIPGVGAQILTGQTIGTSFTDNVDNCGLIIVNRALTAAETAGLTRYLNQRAGV